MSDVHHPVRRNVLRGAAWSVPVIAVATVAPAFAASNEAPVVTTVAPASGPTSGGTGVTVTGSGFVPGSTTVSIDGTPVAGLVVVDANTLIFTTPPHAAGLVDLVVTTPNGSVTASNAFTYTDGPTITSIVPNNGPAVGGSSVSIYGTGFGGTTSVTFGSRRVAFIVVRPGLIVVPITPANPAGPADVTVTTATGIATAVGGYTYVG